VTPPQTFGDVAVITAGTSDLPVAQEAAVTAQAIGCNVTLIADVGVAGNPPLVATAGSISKRRRDRGGGGHGRGAAERGRRAGGIRPVIAVPTSIGYGAAFGGVGGGALLTMLNACPANVVVVNIDAGFKAGYVAALIARRMAQAKASAPTDKPS